GTPTFQSIDEPGAAQEWKIAIDAGGNNCYKITSNADGRYLNEYGVFGTNTYYSDWNTYLITAMGGNYSMQWTQSAVKNGKQTFIIVSGNRLEAKEVARSESYTVKIIAKEDYTSVKEINKNGMSYNGREIYAEDAEVIAIYSIDGRTIAQCAGNTISTAELASGVYIAVAKLNKGTEVLRFVVE
ncbi:MAG: T9SS type A sorting domain-containing protein, partial [Bacteroidaceae bacterium]|nr:T9SS type A sorting domain-containing protein [Bacteroidaceae bacterium]